MMDLFDLLKPNKVPERPNIVRGMVCSKYSIADGILIVFYG